MLADILIRRGEIRDLAVLTEFNCAMARETEQKELFPNVVSAGVEELLRNPSLGFYLVAEHEQNVVGSLMITTEWSDWRNGIFWWIQSVYVRPEFRRQRVYARLYDFIQGEAEGDGRVCGCRLYVEQENVRAQQTYAALGMVETGYKLFEHLKRDLKFFT